jgi:hypothetical protein
MPAAAYSVPRRTCRAHAAPYDPFREADVVAEGVLLSGPRSVYGALLSPARFHVVRYLKGRGPRVIRVRTPQRQVDKGDFGVGPNVFGDDLTETALLPDHDTPRAGEAYRIFANPGNRRRREFKGHIDTCNGDDRKVSIRRVLRPVPRTLVTARQGRSFWRARLFRGRGRLRCLRLVEPSAHFETHGGCGYLRRRHATLVAADDGETTTAIAIAGEGLSGFTATRLSDGARVNALARRSVALALLPGSLERREFVIIARYQDGSTRRFGGLERRATFVDSVGGPQWLADHERAYPSATGKRACVVVGVGPVPGRSGECGSTEKTPLFFAIRRVITHPGGPLIVSRRTAVFGAISQAVSEVTVTGPTGLLRPAISRRGRAFIALFSGHVPASQLTLRFVLSDGRTLTYSGRRELNLAPRPRN